MELPHCYGTEKSVIAAMLFDGELCQQALGHLLLKCFFRTSHRIIFQSAIDLQAAEKAVTLVSITEHLIRTGSLQKVNAYYLASLMDWPIAVSVPYAAGRLRKLSMRRRLIWGANKTMTAALNAPISDVFEVGRVVGGIINKYKLKEAQNERRVKVR